MHEVIMPKLGLTMETGTIEKWHKKEGDKVEQGDILFEVMTDKVSLEVEAYDSGVLRKILRGKGEEVPVTETVAYIGEKDEEIPSGAGKAAPKKEQVTEKSEKKEAVEEKVKETAVSKEKRIKISPIARKIAESKNIDIYKITGSGPGGRIVKEDVTAFSETASAMPEGEIAVKSSTPLKGMRKVIAERMSYSKTDIPHIVLNAVADATALVNLRERIKDKISSVYDVKITYTDFLLKACSTALRESLEVNSSLQNENHIIYDSVNIGLAMSISGGLIVPTIYDCDKKSLIEIAKERIRLVEKAKKGELKLEEIANGTFTLTNLGMFGIRSFSAIINPPQAAILAVGEIYETPVVVNGKIEAGSALELSLACDHRIVDGAVGAKFLQKVVELVENPEILVI
jgi:pyruvate dehydrogenase E2 component (dihydrolipoamide acetyltransferase)